MKLVLDCETTWVIKDKNKRNPSPFLPANKLVSVGVIAFDNDNTQKGQRYYFFNHVDGAPDSTENHARLQKLLNATTLLIGHNIKFDLQWLRECGFTYDGLIWDTMIAEYMLARGVKTGLSLEELAKRMNVSNKKVDLIQPFFDKGDSFFEIPKAIIEVYGIADCKATWEIYLKQCKRYEHPENSGMRLIRDHMFEFCNVLTEVERNGIAIDTITLETIEKEFKHEYDQIELRLRQIKAEVWGDAPLSFSSPEQLSQFVYGVKVRDKAAWADRFRLGVVTRGSVTKRARPRLRSGTLSMAIGALTAPVKHTTAYQCDNCGGAKAVRQVLRGKETKRLISCKNCVGTGLRYKETSGRGSLGLWKHARAEDATSGGFGTDKGVLTYLRGVLGDSEKDKLAIEFLDLVIRQNQIETYLSTFIGGIKRNVNADNILHPSFMQCVTATGRLSGRDPNFQNQPRGGTFPIKRCFVSRWQGGHILEVDYRALEYRCAVDLARDEAGKADILAGVDAHNVTDSFLHRGRQAAKPHTFKPLYGGFSGTDEEIAYYEFFLEKHKGIAKWHAFLQDCVLRPPHVITLPTGRQYVFPEAKRLPNGTSTFATQIKNYPVQGFATADIVPIACILLHKEMKAHGVKSVIINEVHDSILCDVHPGEEELMIKLMRECTLAVVPYLKDVFNHTMFVPLDIEVKMGYNNLDMKEVKP